MTLIPGDGIGPECVTAAQRILEAAGAPIEWDVQEAGAEVFKKGLPSGVPPETMDSIVRTRVALKGPLETPVGFGEKSANVTLRKLFETYANVRPIREMPGVKTPYSGRGVDLVDRPRERRGPLRRHRVHADARRRRMSQAHLA